MNTRYFFSDSFFGNEICKFDKSHLLSAVLLVKYNNSWAFSD